MRQHVWTTCCLLLLFLLVIIALLYRAICFQSAQSSESAQDNQPTVKGGAEYSHSGHHQFSRQALEASDDPNFHRVGVHDLSADRFTGGAIEGGAGSDKYSLWSKSTSRPSFKTQIRGPEGIHWTIEPDADSAPAEGLTAKKAKKAKKDWQLYKSWDDLKKDSGASADYFTARAAALNRPEFDWSSVYASIAPLLNEPREYVGIVGVEPDGRTLKLLASEASPDAIGEGVSATYFAGVPADLVAKYADRPALFFFHTHPADERASPLPSSPDLATAIYFGATARYAASAVISRFGVLVYGLGWTGYKAINSANDWKLALLNYTHDVVAANEAVRSWNWHNLQDYTDFYPKMRMFFYAHPSPQMVATGVHPPIMHCLESDIDHTIISEYSADIARHIAGKKKQRKHRMHAKKHHSLIWTHEQPAPITLDRS